MCLDTITCHSEGIGYKVFSKRKRKIYGAIINKYCNPFVKKRWITDINQREQIGVFGILYKPGFHIYTKLEDAQKQQKLQSQINKDTIYVICKVKYKDLICVGTQDPTFNFVKKNQKPVLVAKSIMIVEEVQ